MMYSLPSFHFPKENLPSRSLRVCGFPQDLAATRAIFVQSGSSVRFHLLRALFAFQEMLSHPSPKSTRSSRHRHRQTCLFTSRCFVPLSVYCYFIIEFIHGTVCVWRKSSCGPSAPLPVVGSISRTKTTPHPIPIPPIPIPSYPHPQGSKLIIDWHNYGFSIMALSHSASSWIVRVAKWYEGVFGRLANHHFCVTKAMQVCHSTWISLCW